MPDPRYFHADGTPKSTAELIADRRNGSRHAHAVQAQIDDYNVELGRAEARARRDDGPVNPYAAARESLEKSVRLGDKRAVERLERMRRWEAEAAEKAEAERVAAERKAAIEADPMVANAHQNLQAMMKLYPEHRDTYHQMLGLLEAGDVKGYWAREQLVMSEVHKAEDAKHHAKQAAAIQATRDAVEQEKRLLDVRHRLDQNALNQQSAS